LENRKLVVKHNNLIESQGKLTALEQKVFLGAISQITTQDEDFKEYQINISQMGKLLKLTTKSLYKELDKATDKLATRLIKIEHINERKQRERLKTTLLSAVKYVDGEGYITVTVDPNLKPYLIQLSEQFTKYELDNIINIKSSHAIRIYELLKQYQTIGNRTFELEELKNCLGVENEYPRFDNFESRILKVAEKEINKKTDLKISYEKIKRGRKIGKINFKIERNKSSKDKQYQDAKELCEITDFNTRKLANDSGLQGFKINDKQFVDFYEIACRMTDPAELDPCEYIKLNYEYMLTKKDIVSPVAYLKSILDNDGADARIKMVKEKFGF